MALTQDQLYNLAVGDEVIVHGKCEDICDDGDIRVNSWWTVAGEKREQSFLVHHSHVSLPPEKPKYDPCRKFKKGDKVRVVERNGRSPILCGAVELGYTYTVYADEDGGDVILDIGYGVNGGESISWTFLELITPVEELEPYSVKDTMSHDGWQIVRDGLPLAIYDSRRHPNAKAAAEAECARLNAEYRKKQQK